MLLPQVAESSRRWVGRTQRAVRSSGRSFAGLVCALVWTGCGSPEERVYHDIAPAAAASGRKELRPVRWLEVDNDGEYTFAYDDDHDLHAAEVLGYDSTGELVYDGGYHVGDDGFEKSWRISSVGGELLSRTSSVWDADLAQKTEHIEHFVPADDAAEREDWKGW